MPCKAVMPLPRNQKKGDSCDDQEPANDAEPGGEAHLGCVNQECNTDNEANKQLGVMSRCGFREAKQEAFGESRASREVVPSAMKYRAASTTTT